MGMSETRSSVLAESKKKGLLAGVSTAAAVTVGVVLASPVAGVVAAVPAAYLGWKWWSHRSKNGIRF